MYAWASAQACRLAVGGSMIVFFLLQQYRVPHPWLLHMKGTFSVSVKPLPSKTLTRQAIQAQGLSLICGGCGVRACLFEQTQPSWACFFPSRQAKCCFGRCVSCCSSFSCFCQCLWVSLRGWPATCTQHVISCAWRLGVACHLHPCTRVSCS